MHSFALFALGMISGAAVELLVLIGVSGWLIARAGRRSRPTADLVRRWQPMAVDEAEAILRQLAWATRGRQPVDVSSRQQTDLAARLAAQGEDPDSWRCLTCGAVCLGDSACACCGNPDPFDPGGPPGDEKSRHLAE